ncbi:MAG: hypothetical protein WC825_02120, partial [Gallionellaceae bacterium]
MGKKSREKRDRREARMCADQGHLLHKFREYQGRSANEDQVAKSFHERLDATRVLIRQYKRLDAAIALSVSELWPANAGSPIKHIFAWGVLLDLPDDGQGEMLI